MSPCMCGAEDCPRCRPGARSREREQRKKKRAESKRERVEDELWERKVREGRP